MPNENSPAPTEIVGRVDHQDFLHHEFTRTTALRVRALPYSGEWKTAMATSPWIEDEQSGQRFALAKATFVGRLDSSQIHLADDRVSRQHAMIRKQDKHFWIFDLGSSNGTYINRQLVNLGVKLRNGDVVSFGGNQFVFRDEARSRTSELEISAQPTRAQIQLLPMLMLVSDIRNFTVISENISPRALAKVMGAWYAECERVISKYGGTIDKFIGDAVLAYWTVTTPAEKTQAASAAMELQRACQDILVQHAEIFDQAGIKLSVGTALHAGNVAHGSVNPGTFTLLGDAVNVAFRLESLTRSLGRDILLSSEFLDGWTEETSACIAEGAVMVKGRSTPVDVYSMTV